MKEIRAIHRKLMSTPWHIRVRKFYDRRIHNVYNLYDLVGHMTTLSNIILRTTLYTNENLQSSISNVAIGNYPIDDYRPKIIPMNNSQINDMVDKLTSSSNNQIDVVVSTINDIIYVNIVNRYEEFSENKIKDVIYLYEAINRDKEILIEELKRLNTIAST